MFNTEIIFQDFYTFLFSSRVGTTFQGHWKRGKGLEKEAIWKKGGICLAK